MRVRILAGRDFDQHDSENAPPVVIINEALVRREFPNENPLGKRITLGDGRQEPKWMTIVGVVKDLKQGSWTDPAEDELYIPFQQSGNFFYNGTGPHTAGMTLVARTNIDAASLARAVKNAAWSVDHNLPISHVETLENTIGGATWQSRFSLLLTGMFSGLALILAMIGIYGVMAYEVAQRTHEIGIRMALGADRGGIAQMIAARGQSLLPVASAGNRMRAGRCSPRAGAVDARHALSDRTGGSDDVRGVRFARPNRRDACGTCSCAPRDARGSNDRSASRVAAALRWFFGRRSFRESL